jgi:hypothetical protein
MFVPNAEVEKEIWFKPDRRLEMDNGALEVSVCEYAIFPPRGPKA